MLSLAPWWLHEASKQKNEDHDIAFEDAVLHTRNRFQTWSLQESPLAFKGVTYTHLPFAALLNDFHLEA